MPVGIGGFVDTAGFAPLGDCNVELRVIEYQQKLCHCGGKSRITFILSYFRIFLNKNCRIAKLHNFVGCWMSVQIHYI